MALGGAQKFVGRNRAPRVQIEYETEVYGATKKIELPFVMAVLSDLKGAPGEDDPSLPLAEREFKQVDGRSLNTFLKSMKPRVAFEVENKLTGEGKLPVEISFTSMDDFTPGKIAEKTPGLKEVYEARTQLRNLLTFIDGKANAEQVLQEILKDKPLLQSLSANAEALRVKAVDENEGGN
jgi:type VI secretion system protein ImpB